MPEILFNLISLLPLPIWLSLLLFPKTRATQTMVLSPWPIVALCGVYAALLLGSLAVGLSGGAVGAGFDFDGLRAALASEWGFLAGWAHYLAFDLFVGIWIFRDAKYYGIRTWPFLLLTLFAGPLGLGSYLLWRRRHERSDPVRLLN